MINNHIKLNCIYNTLIFQKYKLILFFKISKILNFISFGKHHFAMPQVINICLNHKSATPFQWTHIAYIKHTKQKKHILK